MKTNILSINKKPCFVLLGFLILILFPREGSAQFVKGADIGWLQQMEATGYKFYDTTSVPKDCLEILKERGINTVRLRVWVNPSNYKTSGHCSKKEVAAMALRAKNKGMRVMIDFHYSDSWADPSKQYKPAAWANDTFSQLLTDLYNHTYQVLDTLKAIGAKPDWAQVGNEITNGMLWPDGDLSHWSQLAQLLNKGYDAVKAVDTSIKVIIHIDQGNNNSRFRWFFDNVKNNNVRYDIIGASYYPWWLGTDYTVTINDLGNNLDDMTARYGKKVMVVEVGGAWDQVQNTYDMLVAVINKVRAVPNNMGLGVIYWEPEGEKSWSGYNLSCWGSDGKPTFALNAFLTDVTTGINNNKPSKEFFIYPNPAMYGVIHIDLHGITGTSALKIFDLGGKLLEEHTVINQPKVELNTSLKAGMYILNITNQHQIIIRKLIII